MNDAYEVAACQHLVGHPTNLTIWHWFDNRGYPTSGDSTKCEDTAYGSSTSWAGSVPAYATMSSNTIAIILEGRGYLW